MLKPAAALTLALAAVATTTAVAAAPSTVVTTVAASEPFDGATSQMTRGRVFIETPRSWRRTTRNGNLTARFHVTIGADCTARLIVASRNVATRETTTAQLDRATGFALATIAQGTGGAGPWRLVELHDSDFDGQPRGVRPFYGIATKRVARRRYLQVRAVGDADKSCSDAQVRAGRFASALGGLMRTARISVVIRPTPPRG